VEVGGPASPPLGSFGARRAALTVSDAAKARLRALIATKAANEPSHPPSAVRLGLQKRGCNGLSYTLNYAYEDELTGKEEIVDVGDDIKVVIDAQALLSVVGTEMDWVETKLTSEFVFTNPNAKSLCGCKESFSM
jgi:iron-sulfur cluster assembly 1